MALSRIHQAAIAVGAAALFAILLWLGRLYGRWQVTRWCRQQGYELIDWRGAKFFEGPSAWFRSENQDAYYIEVQDKQGLMRSGYLVFGSFWWPWPLNPKVRVKWE